MPNLVKALLEMHISKIQKSQPVIPGNIVFACPDMVADIVHDGFVDGGRSLCRKAVETVEPIHWTGVVGT